MQNFYEKSVKLLTSAEKFHICLGLERINSLLKLFNNPQDKIKIVHVAGTNGKGSVSSIISSILQSSGFKTGLFTSPHLKKYTERIKIDNIEIPDREFYEIINEVNTKAQENNIYLTEFEILTAVGFIYFERQKTDIAVIEVGLGGRYDATNIIKHPLLSVITSISKDHTDRLGSTIPKIAYEKAGILKQDSTCVISETNKGINTISEVAKNLNVKLIKSKNTVTIQNKNGINTANTTSGNFEFSLLGDYQAENLSLALDAIKELQKQKIKIDETHIAEGLRNVIHNGRFQYIKDLNFVIDGAHNPDGAMVLRKSLNKIFGNTPIKFIYATINTKDYRTILKTLLTTKDEVILYEFNRTNAVPTDELKKYITQNVQTVTSKSEIIDIIKQNKTGHMPIVLTGSLYAIGDLYPQIESLIKDSPSD